MTKPVVLLLALSLAAVPLAASAQSEDQLEVVETRAPMEVSLIDADFLRPEDPSISIFGGTTQFLNGEPILIELALTEPISSLELTAMKEPDGAAAFSCDEAVLYLVNGHHVALAEGCSPIDQTEGETQ